MHAVHDPGYTHGRCERPDRRRQGGHFQPDASGERRRGGGVPGRKRGGDRRPARAAVRRYLAAMKLFVKIIPLRAGTAEPVGEPRMLACRPTWNRTRPYRF
jgi:hypothetical protein